MIRLILVLLCAVAFAAPSPSVAQKPGNPTSITPDQARAALDMLNDPAKRAAFTATLNAIVKAQPGGTAATAQAAAADPAKPPAGDTPAPGPLAPDSLGAQVLLGASAFVNQIGVQVVDALETVQSCRCCGVGRS